MSCPDFEVLSAYADGEATPAETSAMGSHLAACPDCSRRLRSIRSAGRALAGLPVPDAPPDLLETLWDASVPRPWWRGLWRELRAGLATPAGAL
ncbi:MAG: zf-HC2 domain-containing protein, partial [Elusimicrobia bacterium]|nr:zf-HC2 domain-containing protein [Elusimicrobiota bacterium]